MTRQAALVIALSAAVLAGCTATTSGVAKPNPAQLAKPLRSADLDGVFVAPEQVSDIVGGTLTLRIDRTRPVGGGPGGPCAGVDTAGADEFVGVGYDAFHVLVIADGHGNQHDNIVTESATVYSDASRAAKQFASASSGLGPCNGRHVRDEADWKFAINDVTPDTVLWNKEQTDLPTLWVCYGQGRVRNNAIIEAMVCRGDDAGAKDADAILDRMSASVWDLSGT